jgi:SHS2 domain-containing protein
MSKKRFEEVPHTADLAIRVWGRDMAELFVNAAYGMACQLGDPESVIPTVEYPIELEALDAETLLVSWLGELLYLGERDGCLFTDFQVLELTPVYLRAVARGGPAQQYHTHIKAVTFSNLKIVATGQGYETTIVFDV